MVDSGDGHNATWQVMAKFDLAENDTDMITPTRSDKSN